MWLAFSSGASLGSMVITVPRPSLFQSGEGWERLGHIGQAWVVVVFESGIFQPVLVLALDIAINCGDSSGMVSTAGASLVVTVLRTLMELIDGREHPRHAPLAFRKCILVH